MTKPIMTGFAGYETASHHGFDQANLSQWLRIVESIKNDQKIQFIIKMCEKIADHTHLSNAHSLDFTDDEHANKLVSDLYTHYRNLGFKGTKSDMLLAIGKQIPIATEKDVLAGISKTKAINNSGWSTLFKKHTEDKLSHTRFLKIYQQDYCCLHKPTVTYLSSVPIYDTENGHDFTEWMPEGTIFFNIQYSNISETDLIKLYGDEQDIVFSVTSTNIKMTRKFNTSEDTETIFDLPLAYTNTGVEKIAIAYDDKMFKLRSLLDETERIFNFRKVKTMEILVPITEIGNKILMKEFFYFPAILSDTDIMALMK